MKDYFERPSLKSQSHRNPFDLSYQFQSTIPFGALLPIGFWPVNPNDKFRISNEYQLICDALTRPAFTRLKAHINYYFVPATQIQMSFDNFITGQDSYFSSAVQHINVADGSRVPSQLPMFNGSFLSSLFADFAGAKDELGYPKEAGAVRLLDHLNYCNLTDVLLHGGIDDPSSTQFLSNLPEFNFMGLACYQKVYYDYYRNAKYEDNDVEAYNLDDVGTGILDYSERLSKLFKMHYRWQKKDYFMDVQPSVLANPNDLGYSGLSSNMTGPQVFGVPGNLISSPSSTRVNTNTYFNASPNDVGEATVIQLGKQNTGNLVALNVKNTVANIRTAFAFDRLLRRMREAGADFDKQMLAQFGVAPYDARHGKCYHIGGYTNQITTNSVTNMTGDDIGELAGSINFYADNSSKKLDYHVREMGYVIGVISISNDNSYQSYRSARYNVARDRFDFFNPVFEDLGLQPLFAFEMDYTDSTATDDTRGQTCRLNPKDILGYVRRYSEYKTRPDEIHGVLCKWSNVQDMIPWNMQYYRSRSKSQQFGVGALNISDMLLDPALFDSVSGVVYNGLPVTDHFILNSYTHFHNVSNMSRLGENF